MTERLVVSRVFLWLVLLVLPISASAQQLEIHYINVNWGGSVFVKGPNGTTVLLEAGNTGKGTNRVVPYLQSIGVMPATGLDYTIAGHQHCDHIGGLDEVIQAGSLNSGSFSNLSTNNESYFQVNSTTSGTPRVTDWYATVTISEAPGAVSQLVTTYNGDYSRNNTTQTCICSIGPPQHGRRSIRDLLEKLTLRLRRRIPARQISFRRPAKCGLEFAARGPAINRTSAAVISSE